MTYTTQLKTLKKHFDSAIVSLITLPWLVVSTAWVSSSILIVWLSASYPLDLIVLDQLQPVLSIASMWWMLTIVIFGSFAIDYVWKQKSRSIASLLIPIITLCFFGFWLVIWPQIEFAWKPR